MDYVTDTVINYFLNAEYFSAFSYAFNNYFPFGSFFWLIGLVIFGVFHFKTKNLAWSGSMGALYFFVISEIPLLVTNAYSNLLMKWFGLILGLIAGFYIYKIIKGGYERGY